nr:4-coumarate--CoA ligase-like 7 [Ipomoea batatas]
MEQAHPVVTYLDRLLVAPAELETLLISHPEIVDAVVIPFPDAEASQIPAACVVRSLNSSQTKEDVQKFIADQIVLEADGYQPYLISPEKGLRSLIKTVLEMAKEPSQLCVDERNFIQIHHLAGFHPCFRLLDDVPGFLEMCTVELVIHHGGNFVKDLELQYINGEVWEVDIDPDLLSYPHLVKFIKEGQYGKIETLYYKALHEPLNKLRVLWNDASVLDLTELAIKYRSCDIYVDHGIDEADLIPCYLLPGCGEPTEGNVPKEPTEGIDGEEPNEGIVGEEPNEGRQSVGDEVNEESDEVNEDATEVSTDDNADVNEESDDEGIEGDEDNYDSAGDDTELSEFENDFGGVTQEDNTGLEGEDLETDKGKSKDPPSHESEEEEGHQKKVYPAKSSAASTSMPSAASSVDASSSMPSAASARRNKPRKRAGGFGVYINQNTGAQILNPGGRGQQILSVGRNASARAKKKQ